MDLGWGEGCWSILPGSPRWLQSCIDTDLLLSHLQPGMHMDSLGMLLGQTQELSLAGQGGSPIMDHSLSQSSADEAIKGGLCCPVAFLSKGMLLPHSIPELHGREAGSSPANGQRHQIPDGHQSSGWYGESCSHIAVLAPQAPPRAGVTETLGLLLLSPAHRRDVLHPVQELHQVLLEFRCLWCFSRSPPSPSELLLSPRRALGMTHISLLSTW